MSENDGWKFNTKTQEWEHWWKGAVTGRVTAALARILPEAEWWKNHTTGVRLFPEPEK